MDKLQLLLCFHCHQPLGNFDWVFEDSYQRSYQPLLQTISQHPRLKFSLHYSGLLYDWLASHQPDYLALLKKLVKRGQIELLSGGYYEPDLSLIPFEDKIGQLELLNNFIKQNFGRPPLGAILPGRACEAQLPKIFKKLALEYTLIDEDYFPQSSFLAPARPSFFTTEWEGETLFVFPIKRQLSESLGHQAPEELIASLKRINQAQPGSLIVLVTDAEKYNSPDYLTALFSLFAANTAWLDLTTFSLLLEEPSPFGLVYLPLDPKSHNFLMGCPAANNLHKKMLEVSSQLKTAAAAKSLFGKHEREQEISKARCHLYQGQGGTAYGKGIHHNHLRQAAYEQLILAGLELDKIKHGNRPFVELTVSDLDKDGQAEVVLANNVLSLYLSPKTGACFELDYKPKAVNLLSTLTLDPAPKSVCSFVDQLLPDDGRPYAFLPNRKTGEVGLRLEKTGQVNGQQIKLQKSLTLLANQSIVAIEYELSGELDGLSLGIEFNFNLKFVEPLPVVKLVDEAEGFTVLLELNQVAALTTYPVETVAHDGAKIYQGVKLLFCWQLAGTHWPLKINLRIE